MTTQRPVPSGEIPENFTLTSQQKQQRPPPISYLLDFGLYLTSGILPSGQENYFDPRQSPSNNIGSTINSFYPSPSSSINFLATYPADSGNISESGISIFNYIGLSGAFSNVIDVSGNNITSFRVNTENDAWNNEAAKSGIIESAISGIITPAGSGDVNIDEIVSYIHYYPLNEKISIEASRLNRPVIVPFLSTYKVSESLFDPYPYKELQ